MCLLQILNSTKDGCANRVKKEYLKLSFLFVDSFDGDFLLPNLKSTRNPSKRIDPDRSIGVCAKAICTVLYRGKFKMLLGKNT